MEANVILAKCDNTGNLFGVRVEKRNGDWFRTWAFKIDEKSAKSEGYDKVRLTGSFFADPEFPGCPHCGTDGFYICGKCGKMNCWSEGNNVTCKWCGSRGVLEEAESFDIDGSGY
jgi:hypothetical protein